MSKFIICLLGGWFGLHKFIDGKVGLGVLYLLTGGLFGIGWIIDTIKYLVEWLNNKPKEAVVTEPVITPIVTGPEPVIDNNVYLSFKVAGVTFKNGRKTRQAILRAFKWGDEEIDNISFEHYEYEGRPAVYVLINDKIVGNVPADTTETFLEYEQKYKVDSVRCEVYGGSKLDDGTRTNYGCEVYIRYLKDA